MNKNISVYIQNIILWVLVLGYYFIITSFSTTPAGESKAESQAVVDVVEKVTDVIRNKDKQDSESWITGKTFHKIVRKTAHVINFFILAFLHGLLFFSNSYNKKYTVLLTFLMGLCGAVIDEITQLFVQGRSCSISDVFVDFSGTILGCTLVIFMYHLFVSKLKRG